jgi:hypothetical protein
MKCEKCGRTFEPHVGWFECVVCRKQLCPRCACGGGELGNFCPAHYKQVKDFIEGLKPRVVIHEYREGYDVREGANLSYYMPRENAEALYDFMVKERGKTVPPRVIDPKLRIYK